MARMILDSSREASFRASFFLCVACSFFQCPDVSRAQSFQERSANPRSPDAPNTATVPHPGTHEKTRAELERELLLPLLLQERELLTHCGPDHPDLVAVQGKIAGVRDYLASIASTSPPQPATESKVTRWTRPEGADYPNARPAHFAAFEQPASAPKPVTSGTLIPTSHFPSESFKPRDRWDGSPRTQPKSIASETSLPTWSESTLPKTKNSESSPGNPRESNKPATLLPPMEMPRLKADAPEKQPASLDQQASTLPELVAHLPRNEASPDGFFLKISWRQVASILAIVLICLVLHLAGFCLIMRRYAARLAPITRPQHGLSQEDSFSRAAVLMNANSVDAQADQHQSPSLYVENPSIDVSVAATLGPTWEEERQQKEDAEKRQGEAIFQQLFEQNMQLRKQLLVTAQGPETT